MVALDLDEHRLHALSDGVLASPHEVGHGLIHFHHVCLACGKRRLDSLAISGARSAEEGKEDTHLGQIMTLFMLRLMSISLRGDRPWANVSGSSVKALQNPV
jgi:hypothetical protein